MEQDSGEVDPSFTEDVPLNNVENALNELAHLRQRWNDRLTV